MTAVINLNSKSQFLDLVAQTPHVVVQAYANWCPPCRAISPIFDKHSGSYSLPGKYAFTRLNIDEAGELAEHLGVRSIPAFYFFKDGNNTGSFTGANAPALEKHVRAVYEEAKDQNGGVDAWVDWERAGGAMLNVLKPNSRTHG